ncbi:MAG: tRNA (adenosine(37)-N6)-threonylcarbamoyltransferase complex dimerization subunit type 1 TsaB [Bacteroidia bacterium]|nr:tRNA (adenosine(37)-N6)-threonylcarbamoyltransferase complex dimerization subunit type 1 TsaB [Bacteroidia bacterium]
MANILWIDTATETGTVALVQEKTCIGWWEYKIEKSHARLITPMIQQIVKDCGLTMKDLNAVAVSGGPGSYTGLRVGVSTAKGIAMALNIPLIALSSLEYIALSLIPFAGLSDAWICPMIDARRMEVYCACYDQSGNETVAVHAKIMEDNPFEDILNQHKIIFTGDGAEKCKSLLSFHPNAWIIPERIHAPERLAAKLSAFFEAGRFEDLVTYEPFYLKNFVATTSTKNKLLT